MTSSILTPPEGGRGREEWRPVLGYEGLYEVSNYGRVRSLYRGGAILRPWANKDGYPLIALNRDGARKTYQLHRMVCRVFHGEPTLLHNEAAHLNGDRADASAANLKWVSKVENHSHKRLHGTHQAGEKHPRAKLTEANVIAIRHASQPYGILAARYGVSWRTISDIKCGKRWRCVIESPTGEAGDAPGPSQ